MSDGQIAPQGSACRFSCGFRGVRCRCRERVRPDRRQAAGDRDLAMERRQRRRGDHRARQGVRARQAAIWQHNPVPGFTTEMMNKLRAQIIAGDPPAVSQLKGPEIAAWSKIAPDRGSGRAGVAAAGYENVVPAELVEAAQAATATGSRCRCRSTASTRSASRKKAADKVGVTEAAEDLGRVQRHRREDEGGRHHSRSPMAASDGMTA